MLQPFSKSLALVTTVTSALLFPMDRASAQSFDNAPQHMLGGTIMFYSAAAMPQNEIEASRALTAGDFDKMICQSPFFDPPALSSRNDPMQKIMLVIVDNFFRSDAFRKDPSIPRIMALCQQNAPAHIDFHDTPESAALRQETLTASQEARKLCRASERLEGQPKAKRQQIEAAAKACDDAENTYDVKEKAETDGYTEWEKRKAEMVDTNFGAAFPEGLPLSGSFGTIMFGWPDAAEATTTPVPPLPNAPANGAAIAVPPPQTNPN